MKIFREKDKFVTSVFITETFSVLYTNFISFIPLECNKIKKILSKNTYPQKFIDKCIQKFLNKMFVQRSQIPTVPKKELTIILLYLGKLSQIYKTRLTKTMNKHTKFCKLRIIFQKIRFCSETLWSSSIYTFSCSTCTVSDIGKTYRHFKVRVSEYQGVSPRTGKPVKGILSTSVRDHMLVCNHKVVHEDFKFLGNEPNRYLLVKTDKPSLNKNLLSQELLLF